MKSVPNEAKKRCTDESQVPSVVMTALFFHPLFQPLTGSPNGFLFSVPPQTEGRRQMKGCLVQRQVLHRRG